MLGKCQYESVCVLLVIFSALSRTSSYAFNSQLTSRTSDKRCLYTFTADENIDNDRRLKTLNVEKKKKIRLDELLIERGIVENVKDAEALILSGDVFIMQDQRLSSPAVKIHSDTVLRVRKKKSHPWASRGGVKLDFALTQFKLLDKVKNCVAIDIGSSTGGFTDVLIHYGAKKVYAVDVGYGLLDYRLREDSRVVLLERTNAKNLNETLILEPGGVDVVVCDASFTSLQQILPNGLRLVKDGGILVCLVKPQFEANREDILPGGIISDERTHTDICNKSAAWLNCQPGWQWIQTLESPIRGLNSKNKEFLMYGIKSSKYS